MYVIAAAMKQELRSLKKELKSSEVVTGKSFSGMRGEIDGRQVLLAVTGVGKVLAAVSIQEIIGSYNPEGVLYVGLGGALNETYTLGDIVVAHTCSQWDMDATRFGFKRGELPYRKELSVLKTDQRLFDAACRYKPVNGSLYSGKILTGDSFVQKKNDAALRFLSTELGGDVVDMEGYGAAVACYLNDVPFLLIRIISDMADGKIPLRLAKVAVTSSRILKNVVVHMLNRLKC